MYFQVYEHAFLLFVITFSLSIILCTFFPCKLGVSYFSIYFVDLMASTKSAKFIIPKNLYFTIYQRVYIYVMIWMYVMTCTEHEDVNCCFALVNPSKDELRCIFHSTQCEFCHKFHYNVTSHACDCIQVCNK